jgi:hypothetical protein
VVGGSGTGRSHVFVVLGAVAAVRGCRVRCTVATKLVNELVVAADEKQLNKTIARYGRVDLLCIDKLGYIGLGPPSGGLAVRRFALPCCRKRLPAGHLGSATGSGLLTRLPGRRGESPFCCVVRCSRRSGRRCGPGVVAGCPVGIWS